MLESPPVSPKTVRHGKRSRQSSRGEVSVGELSQEDTGYDGDVEVVRPDEVEEPETESDNDDTESLRFRRLLCGDSKDEELISKMRRLGWKSREMDEQDSHELERPGVKRLSREVDHSLLNQHGKRTEIEVSELVDSQHQARHAKRRKDSRSNMARNIIKGRDEIPTDTSEMTDGKNLPLEYLSVSTAPDAGNEEMDLD
jgi:hypothetical protein